jgi:DNA-binding LacI/PurR family transcriptional regulator
MAIELLLEQGVGKIGVISHYKTLPDCQFMAAKSAEATWLNAGQQLSQFIINSDAKDCMQLEGYKATRNLLEKNPDIDGIFFTHNFLAEGGTNYINELDLPSADKIKIVVLSYQDVNIFNWRAGTNILLFSFKAIGISAIRLILRHLGNSKIAERIRLLPNIKSY